MLKYFSMLGLEKSAHVINVMTCLQKYFSVGGSSNILTFRRNTSF